TCTCTLHITTHNTARSTICAKASSPRHNSVLSQQDASKSSIDARKSRAWFGLIESTDEDLRQHFGEAVGLGGGVVEVGRDADEQAVGTFDDWDFDAALPDALTDLVPGQAEVGQAKRGHRTVHALRRRGVEAQAEAAVEPAADMGGEFGDA